MTMSRTQCLTESPTVGMRRFFSQLNLDRYRRLASGLIGEAEQHQLLVDLAEEIIAFRRAARMAGVNRSLASNQNTGFQKM